MKHPFFFLLGLCAALAGALALSACETAKPNIKMPARLLYLEAQNLQDQELFSEAVTKFQEVADQNPGTLLGTFAYLKMAEINVQQDELEEAQTNYRLFITSNQNSHLTSYVLYRMISVAHRDSYTGFFFPEREVDRDMEPNRRIIREYKRFFFLFPKSIYMDEVRGYFRDARETLAEHERLVADFYFHRELYNAAASRYAYLLRNYPQYRDTRLVLEKLILSYRKDQQSGLADEMERLYRRRYTNPEGNPRPHDAAQIPAAEGSPSTTANLP